ncbi:MAG: aminoacyl--tRNA ligase-related protein, partial [Nanoarchaeota archaeon]
VFPHWDERKLGFSSRLMLKAISLSSGVNFKEVEKLWTKAGDLGIVAAKKYDLEVWMPRQKGYKEAASASNCTDYQARRLNIKYGKEGGDKFLAHTLNNTVVATSRALVAIIENYQNRDGSITVPKVLVPYMNGTTVIRKR